MKTILRLSETDIKKMVMEAISLLKESSDYIYDIISDLTDETDACALYNQFMKDKKNGVGRIRFALIPKEQYRNLLVRYMSSPETARIPENVVKDWFENIIVKNSCIINTFNSLFGHSTHFPGEELADATGIPELENFEKGSEYLDRIGFYDWATLPDGSDAISDYGLQPLFEILKEYTPNSTPEEILVLINRALDVYHCRGDLASAFIEGGSKTCSSISLDEGTVYTARRKSNPRDNLFKFGKYIGKDKMVIIRKDPEYCVWLVQNLEHSPFTDKQLAQLDVEYYRKYQVFPIKSSLTPKYAKIKGKLVSQMSAEELQYVYNNGNDEMKWLVRQEHQNRGWVKRHGGQGTAGAPAFQSDDVGDEAWMNESRKKKTDFFEKHGIKKETLPGNNVPSIGFSETEQKWYGWSHRAIYGFGVGSKVKKGHAGYKGKEWTAKTLDDAKKMAINFANDVSE